MLPAQEALQPVFISQRWEEGTELYGVGDLLRAMAQAAEAARLAAKYRFPEAAAVLEKCSSPWNVVAFRQPLNWPIYGRT
ncbi:MAG: hypothetical protein NZ899_14005 [Thermoguttaceae bacterium]|nr:hypothetical protein [Thermoguttaceae bacterium]MDW8080110.1 hypothetical protein [Thermoguttaceae bacterium]